ncbi:hypothetical protein HRM2_34870 [Desulforapulum autotrophicum HRM2]|uniref:Ice-binding protein C-terminal domain-containing protein n=1 Tax=Desulforapulum autotrophicum (strain ATCC 43914 / DSM 3382 / VKM B-1955 / HRM2) TaxID=177437 RepID=C0Q956_DESAH|nr:hypothetical protein HRM2_34870 [Desulforapulum autotrophicum HRM2]
MWFDEETWFNDSFKLYSAKLEIYGMQTAPTANPEPATMMLLGLGLLGIAGVSRKKAYF